MENFSFVIQAGNPRTLQQFDADDESVADALQTVFPLQAEDALLNWNGIFVPLSYKYDVSLMIEDAVALVREVLHHSSGQMTVHWPSNTFAATWRVSWTREVVKIDADWMQVVGGTEALLRAKPAVAVAKADFVAEWKKLFETTIVALDRSGYSVTTLRGLDLLRDVAEELPSYGALYRSS